MWKHNRDVFPTWTMRSTGHGRDDMDLRLSDAACDGETTRIILSTSSRPPIWWNGGWGPLNIYLEQSSPLFSLSQPQQPYKPRSRRWSAYGGGRPWSRIKGYWFHYRANLILQVTFLTSWRSLPLWRISSLKILKQIVEGSRLDIIWKITRDLCMPLSTMWKKVSQ